MVKWICKSFLKGGCCEKEPCRCGTSMKSHPLRCLRDGYNAIWVEAIGMSPTPSSHVRFRGERESIYKPTDGESIACVWRLDTSTDTDYWVSECGSRWVFTDGGPVDNGMVYCHKCGRPARVEMPEEEAGE
jgi:hypothetical protein